MKTMHDRKNGVVWDIVTAGKMKNAVFWDMMQCGSSKNRRFGGAYRLHLQSDKTLSPPISLRGCALQNT
jgi:hypothetical protein